MTHAEIISKMDDFNIGLSNGFGDAKTLVHFVDALRAVVELHKPKNYIINGFEITESWCTADSESLTPYPCPTIQAIEKELQ